MRFLFCTLQFDESDFYGRVGRDLERRGHEVFHVAYSRRSARKLGGTCLPDAMARLGPLDVDAEAARIERMYDTPSLRDVYRTDWPLRGRSERHCIERTVRHFVALERIFDEVAPDVLVPEVGSETMRTAAHLIGLERGVRVLFVFYTIFPNPLRLYEDTMHAGIVAPEEVRELSESEREEVERFIADFTARDKPIRRYRAARATFKTGRDLARHLVVRATEDRDNEYLVPGRYLANYVRENARAALMRRYYSPVPDRPFVYFPLHVTDDYKIKRVIPHCVDQAALIEQVADYLPQGMDVVIKEHPLSIGRNSMPLIHRLTRRPNIHLVEPRTSSHDLIQRARAVAVISSTVGLEALLYGRPVLTLGQPFYSGYGVTLDVDSFRVLQQRVMELLDFQPDRERTLRFLHAAMRSCFPGAPVAIDPSDENARRLAASLDTAARGQGAARGPAREVTPASAQA
jgi:capsular polysaccharide biosynthesis protein